MVSRKQCIEVELQARLDSYLHVGQAVTLQDAAHGCLLGEIALANVCLSVGA